MRTSINIRINRVENGLVATFDLDNRQYQKIAKDEDAMRELISKELEMNLVPEQEPTK